MATAAGTRRPMLPAGRTDPMVDIGIAPPRVRWSLTHEDRKKGVIIAGGQGSGKSATLQKFVEGDVLSPNTATIVFDMKGTLAERLLRMIPPDLPKRYFDHSAQLWRDGTKRVWYLDLAEPAFGLTPLHVEPGWTLARLPNEFVRIAGMVVHALMDLFEDQIFQSSQDIIERSVIGTMAIAWFEHDERHRKAGTNPEQHGFGGSFEVLHKMLAPTDRLAADAGDRRAGPKPNPWHQAAGRACQQIPGLRNAAEMLLYELPALARNNLARLEDRLQPPANKLGPLVTSHAAVRDFVGHPSRLSLRSVIEAHDILIVNPRTDILGQDSPTILVNFLVHMIDAQLDRQISMDEPTTATRQPADRRGAHRHHQDADADGQPPPRGRLLRRRRHAVPRADRRVDQEQRHPRLRPRRRREPAADEDLLPHGRPRRRRSRMPRRPARARLDGPRRPRQPGTDVDQPRVADGARGLHRQRPRDVQRPMVRRPGRHHGTGRNDGAAGLHPPLDRDDPAAPDRLHVARHPLRAVCTRCWETCPRRRPTAMPRR